MFESVKFGAAMIEYSNIKEQLKFGAAMFEWSSIARIN